MAIDEAHHLVAMELKKYTARKGWVPTAQAWSDVYLNSMVTIDADSADEMEALGFRLDYADVDMGGALKGGGQKRERTILTFKVPFVELKHDLALVLAIVPACCLQPVHARWEPGWKACAQPSLRMQAIWDVMHRVYDQFPQMFMPQDETETGWRHPVDPSQLPEPLRPFTLRRVVEDCNVDPAAFLYQMSTQLMYKNLMGVPPDPIAPLTDTPCCRL